MGIKYLKIKKKEFSQMAQRLGWSGIGTQEDPIIIDSHEFTEFIQLWRIDLHVIFRNCTFNRIRFDFCKNLEIIDSVFKSHLTIFRSNYLELHSCKIYFLFISRSKYNLIKNCIFFGFDNPISGANTFERCYFFKRYRSLIIEGDLDFKNYVRLGYSTLMLMSPVGIIFGFTFRIDSFLFWFFMGLSIIGFMLGFYLWIKGRGEVKYPPNVIK